MASTREAVAAGAIRPATWLPTSTRVAAIGISIGDPCGVHDHAVLLARALDADGVSISSHWLRREAESARGARAEVTAWAARLPAELEAARADAVLLHYSVFAFSHRGVPLLVGPVLAALRARGLPLVSVLHEFAYPWRLGGVRGKVWAASQRVALAAVMRDAAAVVVTAESRLLWLRGRAWLPRRPVLLAPVFSNLPPAPAVRTDRPDAAPAAPRELADAGPAPASTATLGLFGYAHEGVAVETVLDALRRLREDGADVALVLLGAPGGDSEAAAAWRQAARARGVEGLLGFSGTLPARQLADLLARCDVLLFAERGGPTSRKTTLAASLASGRPVVALDGHSTWHELASARAARIVAADSSSLAQAIARLLGDGAARERQGRAGRDFAARTMSVEHSAHVVEEALARALGHPAP